MQFDLERFRDVFFLEVEEHLATMESGLLRLESDTDPELLNEIFRAAHSIKGASSTFGFDEMSHFTHALETLLDRMRKGQLQPTPARTAVLLQSLDLLRQQVAAAKGGGTGSPDTSELINLLALAQNTGDFSKGAAHATETLYRICFVPGEGVMRTGMDPLLILSELSRGASEFHAVCDLTRLPGLEELEPDACYLGWNIRTRSRLDADAVRGVFAFVEDDSELRIEIGEERLQPGQRSTHLTPSRDVSSIRVSTAKVDKLIDLVGELVIAQSMAAQVLTNFSMSRLGCLHEAFAEMERYTRELQERVMGVRMLPIGSVFSRFPRMVHDTAAALGKQIVIEMSGEETELDKTVVESMSDPLNHLIRNAIDHGIESPLERQRTGKAEAGVIRLRAFHQEGNVQIEVSDDGRGLDLKSIRAKAIERELIREGEELTAEAVTNLVFAPGLSTAAQVSDLSGRGVGMDVVKRKVQELNGTISIGTEPGRGTTVRMKLPLTLAILEGLLVKVGNQKYILPLISILESIRPSREQLSTLSNRAEMVLVRGEPVQLMRLHLIFNISEAVADPTHGLLVLMESRGRKVALLVDELLGQQQVVVKSLETHFQKVAGILGATILGDGRAALIIDTAGLMQLAQSRPGAQAEEQGVTMGGCK